MSCIFCKIINKKISADIVFENKDIIAFKDIKPIASVHVLVVPKKHIISVADANDDDVLLMGKLIMVAKKIAEDLGISNKGYKLLIRVGKGGGQEVGHIHLHLLGGKKIVKNINIV